MKGESANDINVGPFGEAEPQSSIGCHNGGHAGPGGLVVGPAVPASASTVSPALSHIGGSLTVWSEWTSVEQQYFEAAYAPFTAETGITINYQGESSNIAATVQAAVAGGKGPDVAFVPSPATLTALAAKGSIQP